jgi:rhamnose utilization protein RhaD (predicted bifunctional aldolase and dehydrogenase)
MDKSLAELIYISRRVGRDPNLTCGASGNTSVKTADGKFMFVKASGTALSDMNAKKGWCKINLQAIREIEDKKLEKLPSKKRDAAVVCRLLAACDKRNRPSIETNLHAFLDKCVIHLHPIAVGAFVHSKNGKAKLKKLFSKEKFPHLWVSYANPGFALAKKIASLSGKYQKKYGRLPQILFLEKHGLFVSASTSKQALKLIAKVISCCSRKLTCPAVKKVKKPNDKVVNAAKLTIRDAFFEATGQKKPVHFFHNKIIATFANRADTGRLLKAGPLNPNEIIYCNGPAVWLESPPSPSVFVPKGLRTDKKASAFVKTSSDKMAGKLQKDKIMPYLYRKVSPSGKKQKPPIAILVKNLGLFVVGGKRTALTATQVVCSSLFIRYNAQRLGGIVAMTKAEQDFIRNFGG